MLVTALSLHTSIGLGKQWIFHESTMFWELFKGTWSGVDLGREGASRTCRSQQLPEVSDRSLISRAVAYCACRILSGRCADPFHETKKSNSGFITGMEITYVRRAIT